MYDQDSEESEGECNQTIINQKTSKKQKRELSISDVNIKHYIEKMEERIKHHLKYLVQGIIIAIETEIKGIAAFFDCCKCKMGNNKKGESQEPERNTVFDEHAGEVSIYVWSGNMGMGKTRTNGNGTR